MEEREIVIYLDNRNPGKPRGHPELIYPSGIITSINKFISSHTPGEVSKFIDIHFDNYVRKRSYFDGPKEWIRKIRTPVRDITVSNDFGGYKIKHRIEVPLKDAEIPKIMEYKHINAKMRMSFQWGTNGTDRLDITGVKICTIENVNIIKTKMNTNIHSLSDFTEGWDFYEIELESMDATNPDSVYKSMLDWINFEIQDCVFQAAQILGLPLRPHYGLPSKINMNRIVSKAIEPTLEDYQNDWCWEWPQSTVRLKINGEREIITITKTQMIAWSNKKVESWPISAPDLPRYIVLDTEYYNGIWYILHWLQPPAQSAMDVLTEYKLLTSPDFLKPDGPMNLPAEVCDDFAICPVYPSITWPGPRELETWWQSSRIPTDGLIIQTPDGAHLKWKPINESNFDFTLVECPDWLYGKAPFTTDGAKLFLLCIGIKQTILQNGIFGSWFRKFGTRFIKQLRLPRSDYVLWPFCPANNPTVCIYSLANDENQFATGDICEFIYNNGSMKFVRLRQDRISVMRGGSEYGNDYKTSIDIWSKITKPFHISNLWPPTAGQNLITDNNQTVEIGFLIQMFENCEFDENKVRIGCGFVDLDIPFAEITANLKTQQPVSWAYLYSQLSPTRDTPDWIMHIRYPKKQITQRFAENLPTPHATGFDILVARSAVGSGPLWSYVASGGYLVILDGTRPPGDCCEVYPGIWFHSIRGDSEMTDEQIIKENPHLATMDNNPNFRYKYARQKTKDIAGLNHMNSTCVDSFHVDIATGDILCQCEFVCNRVQAGVNVLHYGPSKQREILSQLFTSINFVDEAQTIRDNLHSEISFLMVSRVADISYQTILDKIKLFEPHYTLMYMDHTTLQATGGPVIKPGLGGNMFFIPHDNPNSSAVCLHVRGHSCDTWNILADQFSEEMRTFHRSYRASCFKYQMLPGNPAGFDNCYDCRTRSYIIGKITSKTKLKACDVLGLLDLLNKPNEPKN